MSIQLLKWINQIVNTYLYAYMYSF